MERIVLRIELEALHTCADLLLQIPFQLCHPSPQTLNVTLQLVRQPIYFVAEPLVRPQVHDAPHDARTICVLCRQQALAVTLSQEDSGYECAAVQPERLLHPTLQSLLIVNARKRRRLPRGTINLKRLEARRLGPRGGSLDPVASVAKVEIDLDP